MGAVLQDPKAMLDSPITLSAAEVLYQPVHGTSQGSIYFLIAVSTVDNVKVAARLKKNALSVRVQGPSKDHSAWAKLSDLGFVLKNSSVPYASIHLCPSSDIDSAKALGALLFAMPFTWDGGVGNPYVVMGHGK